MDQKNHNIHKDARKIIVQYAIFRWENAVLLAGTILLTMFYEKPFSWWPSWGWPILGILSICAIFYSSLKNTEANAHLLLKSFQENFDPEIIRLPELRGDIKKALQYQRRIDEFLWQQDDSPLWSRAQDTANQICDWVKHIYQLAFHLDTYKRDKLIKQELQQLPKEIKDLKNQRNNEKDQDILNDFNKLINSKQKHLDTLQNLASKMKQADLQLKHSLSSLATVDSQIRLIAVQDVDRGRADRLNAEIQEQVNRLGDLLSSINEVYNLDE